MHKSKFLLGGASFRGKISLICISLLGITAGAGVANVEIYGNNLSSIFTSLGKIFKGTNSQTQNSQSQSFNPISSIVETGTWVWESALSKVAGFISSGYEWAKGEENRNTIINFLKNFWSFEILKQILFNFPWTVLAWIKIFMEKEMVYKLPLALKRSKTLALAFLSKLKEESDSLKMINWIYLRLFINPRKTLNILSRAQIDERLICKQPVPPPQKKWLGNCFFENGQNGKKGKPKLKNEIKIFFETGKNLKEQKSK